MFTLSIESFLLYLLGVLGLSKKLRDGVVTRIIDTVGLLNAAGDMFKGDFLNRIFPRASAKLIDPQTLQNAFSNTFVGISKFFSDATDFLRKHASDIAKRLEPNDDLRTWRIFGYLFQLMFLIAFGYADLVQLVNNFAVILPQDIGENPIFNNLTLSLLVTSVGTAVAAGFIIAEFAGITNFGRWHEIKSPWTRWFIQFFTWFALIFTLVIDVVVALVRITTIPDIAPLLSPETVSQIKLAAAFAQSLVILPLFILTFLFLGGVVGIAILYIVIVWLISLVVQVIHLLFIGIVWLLVFSVSYLLELIFRAILWIITVLLFVFGWVFAGVGVTLVKLLGVMQSLLDVVYSPLDALVNWMLSRFDRSQQTQSKSTK